MINLIGRSIKTSDTLYRHYTWKIKLTKEYPIETQAYFENRSFKPDDIVVSPKFGIGVIKGIEFLDGLEKSFFTISSIDNKLKNLIPTDTEILIRKVSTRNSFNKSLDKINQKDVANDYDCRKDRIAAFQDKIRSNKVTLPTILSVIKEIQQLKDKGAVERQMMNELLTTVSREYAFVFECDSEDAKKIIKKRLIQ